MFLCLWRWSVLRVFPIHVFLVVVFVAIGLAVMPLLVFLNDADWSGDELSCLTSLVGGQLNVGLGKTVGVDKTQTAAAAKTR